LLKEEQLANKTKNDGTPPTTQKSRKGGKAIKTGGVRSTRTILGRTGSAVVGSEFLRGFWRDADYRSWTLSQRGGKYREQVMNRKEAWRVFCTNDELYQREKIREVGGAVAAECEITSKCNLRPQRFGEGVAQKKKLHFLNGLYTQTGWKESTSRP